jgi:replicative DNA helicase
VLLGDGGLTKNRVTFTTADKEMLEYIKLPEGVRINKIPSGKYAYSIVSTTTSKNKLNKNTILNELKSLDLIGKKSEDKFIPTQYKLSSEFQRLELLQGLLDTDGFVSPKGQIEYSSSSKQLAYDVKFLCESLGIRCNLTKRKTKKLDNYRLKILTSKPIFKLKRKLDKLNTNPSKYANTNRERVAIRDIQPTIVEDSYCISVDGEDNLFIVNDAIPTHNSFSVGLGIVLHEWLFDGLTH